MGIYDRDYYQEPAKGMQLGLPQSFTGQLILVNLAVYLLDALIVSSGWIGDNLSLHPSDLYQPWYWWRLLTYGFLHDRESLYHILGNMLGLFFFGRDVEAIYGARKYLRFYLSAVILSGLVWLIVSQTSDSQAPVIGASGAITAVLMLFIIHYPRRTILLNFFIPVPAWVMGVGLILMNILGQHSGQDRVAYDVHLAGAAYAWLFYSTQWELFTFWRLPLVKFPTFRRSPSLKIHRPSRSADQLAEQADVILEKLHREGEQSLSSRERAILEEYSRSVRSRRS